MATHQSKKNHFLMVLTFLFLIFPIAPSRAALFDDYTFTEIAGPDDDILIFQDYDIDNTGTVVFSAVDSALQQGIFTGSGDSTTRFATRPQNRFGGYPAISNGKIVFVDVPTQTLFTASSNDPTTLSPLVTAGESFSRLGFADINSLGLVAFTADRAIQSDGSVGDKGLFTTNGSTTEAIIDFFPSPFTSIGVPRLNDHSEISFYGRQNFSTGVYRATIGGVTTIADTNGPFSSFLNPPLSFLPASINESGTVAFYAGLDSGGDGLFSSNGVTLTAVADRQGPLLTLGISPTINSHGQVLFTSRFDDPIQFGGPAIMVGPDPANDQIIGFGDNLFGLPIIDIGQPILNDFGQFAFSVTLDDNGRNRRFLVRADPQSEGVVPEPSSFFLLGSGLLGLFGWRRRI